MSSHHFRKKLLAVEAPGVPGLLAPGAWRRGAGIRNHLTGQRMGEGTGLALTNFTANRYHWRKTDVRRVR
jgi:hypothetical protein